MFRVLFADTGLPVVPETFATPKAANDFIKIYRESNPAKLRMERVVTEAWREREAKRLADGTYTPLPESWTNSEWWQGSVAARDHYAHIAQDGMRVSFTENAVKGETDTQLVLSPTSYLGRYFKGVLGSHEIARIGMALGASRYPLHMSDDPNDFERVYSRQRVCGESSDSPSCMSYPKEHFSLPFHPARAYAGGDLKIAWLQNPDSDEFEVLARAIIFPEKKEYVRVYSQAGKTEYEMMVREHLEKMGYQHNRAMTGYRLAKIDVKEYSIGKNANGEAYLIPYLDGGGRIRVEADHMVACRETGDTDGSSTRGYVMIAAKVTCAKTGRQIREDHAMLMHGGEYWHADFEHETFYCHRTRHRYPIETPHTNVYEGNYHQVWVNTEITAENTFRCDRSGRTYMSCQEAITVVVARDGTTQRWASHTRITSPHYFYCERTEKYYSKDVFTKIIVYVKSRRFGSTQQAWCQELAEGLFFRCPRFGSNFENASSVVFEGVQMCEDAMLDIKRERDAAKKAEKLASRRPANTPFQNPEYPTVPDELLNRIYGGAASERSSRVHIRNDVEAMRGLLYSRPEMVTSRVRFTDETNS